MNGRFHFAAALLILILTARIYAFDIAIYHDPLSEANDHYLYAHRHGDNRTYETFISNEFPNLAEQMDSMYYWYREMGVTKVMVNYPFLSNYDWILGDSTGIKLMNVFIPADSGMSGDMYANAEYRDVQVGERRDQNPLAFWSYPEAVRNPALRTTYQPSQDEPNLNCVAMGPGINGGNGSADTLWRATSNLGRFSGWDWYFRGWRDGNIYMPMHFRLTWAVNPNDTEQISAGDTLADFYWLIHTPVPDDPDDNIPSYAKWWRYPAIPVTLNSPADTLFWNETIFVDSLNSGWYHWLDDTFAVVDSGEWSDLHFGPAYPRHALDDEIGINAPSYSGGEVRMAVWYRGTHAFYLNRIEAYDEGAYRMFASADSNRYDSLIGVALHNEYDHAFSRMAGWYYDEWETSGQGNGNPVLRSVVKMNKIMQSHSLPTMFLNGYAANYADYDGVRNGFLGRLDDAGVFVPVQMNEMYPFGADSCNVPDTCEFPCAPRRGLWGVLTEFYPTDTSSDVDYIRASESGCGLIENIQHTYHGAKSLQAAIDAFMFDNRPLYTIGSINTLPWNSVNDIPTWFSIAPQVKWLHEQDSDLKYWALIAGGGEGENNPNVGTPLRDPTSNETKLNAWLAVAADADGIMWYPWSFGGLLEWTDANHTDIEPTERFAGAREAGQKIQRIAPTLESLAFVKTYASRAFETDYPDSTYDATSRDILATNCWWSSQPFRSVQSIASYAQGEGNNWNVEDVNPYVQVSRFRGRLFEEGDPTREDYWFLIVNRRALPEETRKVRITVEIDTAYAMSPYWIEYMLEDTLRLAEPCGQLDYDCLTRWIEVTLSPGGAELVHFYRGQWGCDEDYQVDIVQELTAHLAGADALRLRWAPVQGTGIYYVCKSINSEGPWAPFAATTDTTYVDSTYFPDQRKQFYAVQACFE